MSHNSYSHSLPAPCIIDKGIVVNKDDMTRLLNTLSRVSYIHSLDHQMQSEGEGFVLEVFADPTQATLVANHGLCLNVLSFDYLELHQSPNRETYYDLVQDNRVLRLIPLANPLQEETTSQNIDEAALEAMLGEVLSAKWDVQIDDDDCGF
ncbi:MAG: hypothetical protein AAGG51_20720 [Cyanobacteria bacterium P01_G01_bin.54]